MNSKTLFASCLLLCVFAVGIQTATAGQIINLDSHVHAFSFNPLIVHLEAGTYMVTPVGVAGGGLFDAWSDWPANLNCGPTGICERGFDEYYQYAAPSIGEFSLWDGNRYETELQALSHGLSSTFTLAVAEDVRFGHPDCPGCQADNRGGISLEINSMTAVPEPGTLLLLGSGLLGAAAWVRRRAGR